MNPVTITIHLDAKCVECHKPGATNSGVCLKCATKAMRPESKMKSQKGRELQAVYKVLFAHARAR